MATFVFFLLLSVGVGLIAVIVAFVVGRLVPRAHDTCAKCIAGWSTKRGLCNRLLIAPLVITLAIFVAFTIMGLTDTSRVRNRITDSTRVIIRSGGNCHRRPEQERVLLQLDEADRIRELSERIAIGLGRPGMRCMCCGDMTFDFYRDGKLHYSFSFHHGRSIRIKDSGSGDKELSLVSMRRLSEWLEKTGVTRELEDAREQEAQRRKAEREAAERHAQPAGGAYVAPAAGAPSAHP